ncbi:MAG TPA: hypothetical protein VKR06_26025, partial [Ktedonosporobacter sp.]|nr:hypothetical protein [Ktedonosporobacter sp.]
ARLAHRTLVQRVGDRIMAGNDWNRQVVRDAGKREARMTKLENMTSFRRGLAERRVMNANRELTQEYASKLASSDGRRNGYVQVMKSIGHEEDVIKPMQGKDSRPEKRKGKKGSAGVVRGAVEGTTDLVTETHENAQEHGG